MLAAISGYPGDLEPVFSAMITNAVQVCDATFGNIYRWDGKNLHLVASNNTPGPLVEARKRVGFFYTSDDPVGRMVATKNIIHSVDISSERDYIERRNQSLVASVELGHIRSFLGVPLLKDNELIGSFHLSRQEVRPFTDKQIELIKNFAAQAVIAIENARLLNELRQSLEQQTATSQVLQVISSSPGELEPAFATMLEKAVSICDAGFGNIYRAEGDGLRNVATHNTPAAFVEALKNSPHFRPGPKNPVRRMMETKAVVHVVDNATTEAYAEREPIAVASCAWVCHVGHYRLRGALRLRRYRNGLERRLSPLR